MVESRGQLPYNMPIYKKLKKSGRDEYLDSSEKYLLNFFDRPQSEKFDVIQSTLSKEDTPWTTKYHLSPRREMLLSWYSFKRKSRLLEIGAGCGAITNIFIERVDKVVANELSPSRAKVIERRFADKDNLEIIVGDVLNYDDGKKYDYVTLIGVLEYAGKYGDPNDPDPFLTLLKKARKFLTKNGVLLLAIENKLGLKYLTGSYEDHLGAPFVGLENYPQNKDIQTFSKTELTNLLEKAGFKRISFFYPFPDYKLPQIVFSEEGLNSIKNMTKSTVLKTVDYSNNTQPIYNEVAFGHSLYESGLLAEFSNSFLVEAN